MRNVFIQRAPSTPAGTFGKLVVTDSGLWLFSGELPDHDNAPGISCIPAGTYRVKWTWSPSFRKYTYQIMNVPGRSGIRIHAANYFGDKGGPLYSQVEGCVGLGRRMGPLGGQMALKDSGTAIRIFETHMDYKDFTLEVRNAA